MPHLDSASQDKLVYLKQAHPFCRALTLAYCRALSALGHDLKSTESIPRSSLIEYPSHIHTVESNLGHVPFTRSLTECTEAGRHLGPRSAQAWRGARTQGSKRPRAQGLKRPPAKDPDRAIYLSFYLSAGGAPHGPSQYTAHTITIVTSKSNTLPVPRGKESSSAAPAHCLGTTL